MGCCPGKLSLCFTLESDLTFIQVAEEDGVDLEHPPNSKLFDTTYNDPNDINLLSRRRLATVNSNQPVAPNFVIHNHFEDPAAITNKACAPAPRLNPPVPRAALLPKMSLEVFCETFNLSYEVMTKLKALKITGPHGLRYVTNTQLMQNGQMEVGEVADVRDSQER